MTFEIHVSNVDQLHAVVTAAGKECFLPIEERWYRRDGHEVGIRQFAVRNPDGYLIRLLQTIGHMGGFHMGGPRMFGPRHFVGPRRFVGSRPFVHRAHFARVAHFQNRRFFHRRFHRNVFFVAPFFAAYPYSYGYSGGCYWLRHPMTCPSRRSCIVARGAIPR